MGDKERSDEALHGSWPDNPNSEQGPKYHARARQAAKRQKNLVTPTRAAWVLTSPYHSYMDLSWFQLG